MNFFKNWFSESDGGYSPQLPRVGEGKTFLHGYLTIHVESAKDIPNMESWISTMYDKTDVTDPFVDVRLGNARIAKTSVIDNDLNPVWNEKFRIEQLSTHEDHIQWTSNTCHLSCYSESMYNFAHFGRFLRLPWSD